MSSYRQSTTYAIYQGSLHRTATKSPANRHARELVMAQIIKYKTRCFYCKQWFEKGQAWLQKTNGQWFCQCDECYKIKMEEMAKITERVTAKKVEQK